MRSTSPRDAGPRRLGAAGVPAGGAGGGCGGTGPRGGAACSAANWSEVAQKVLAHGRDWDLAAALLHGFGLRIEPVTAADAEWAARRWRAGERLSLADRLCLALAARLDATVWTADLAWGSTERIRQLRDG